jgi:hypothetical protein
MTREFLFYMAGAAWGGFIALYYGRRLKLSQAANLRLQKANDGLKKTMRDRDGRRCPEC